MWEHVNLLMLIRITYAFMVTRPLTTQVSEVDILKYVGSHCAAQCLVKVTFSCTCGSAISPSCAVDAPTVPVLRWVQLSTEPILSNGPHVCLSASPSVRRC